LLLDQHELVCVAVVERRKKHSVHHGKDSRIGTNTECQCEDRRERQRGPSRQHANGVREIAPEDVKMLRGGGAKDIRNRREPDTRQAGGGVSISALGAKRRCHFALVVAAKLRRQ
jgi:hypothetical protein